MTMIAFSRRAFARLMIAVSAMAIGHGLASAQSLPLSINMGNGPGTGTGDPAYIFIPKIQNAVNAIAATPAYSLKGNATGSAGQIGNITLDPSIFPPMSHATNGAAGFPVLDSADRLKVGATGWLENVIPNTESLEQFGSISLTGNYGGVFATRSSDNPNAGSMSANAIGGFVLNNNASAVQSADAMYLEARRSAGAGYTSAGEFGTLNLGSLVQISPYSNNPAGLTSGLRLEAGRGDVSGENPVTVAIQLFNNGETYDKGIVINSDALSGCTGTSGVCTAVAMGLGAALQWYTPAGGEGAQIRSDAATSGDGMRQVFGDGLIAFQNQSGSNLFTFTTGGALTATSFTGNLANATGLPIGTGVSGLGTGVATALGNALLGSGSLVAASSNTLPSGLTIPGATISNATVGGSVSNVGVFSAYTVTDMRWGMATCAGNTPCAVGTGGDDSAPINAAIAAAATNPGGGGLVVFPPPSSGNYNVCAAPLTRPSAAYNSITLFGAGSGATSVRVLPGCSSGIQEVVNDPGIAFGSPANPSSVRMAIENMRLDAYCIAPHVLNSYFDPGFNSHNVVYRNAAGGYDANGNPSSDIFITGAYEGNLDASNRIENLNDGPSHICYSHQTDFPGYNLYTTADDWTISAPAIGAEIANYAAVSGGGNSFLQAHGWGYGNGNSDGQTDSQPLYTFLTRGYQILTSVAADSPVLAGGRAQVIPGSANVDRATGIVSGGSGGSPNTIVTLTGTTGTGTKFQAVGWTNNFGSLAGVVWVTVPGSYSVNPTNLNNEPVTSTAGLTGVALKIVMGSGGTSTDSPQINGLTMEGVLSSSTWGWQLGVAETKFSLTNGQFEYLANAGACLETDGTLSSDAIVLGNINCNTAQVPAALTAGGGLNLPNGQPIAAANAAGTSNQVFLANSSNDLYFGDIFNNFAGAVRFRASGNDGLVINSNSTVSVPNCPTADPHVAGELWCNAGVVTRSGG